jgi:hypothetical protein
MTALAVGNCLVSVSKGHDEEYMNIASEAKVFAIRPQE